MEVNVDLHLKLLLIGVRSKNLGLVKFRHKNDLVRSRERFNLVARIKVDSASFCKPKICCSSTFLHVATLHFFRFSFIFFMLWQHNAYSLVRFRHKNHMVRVRKTSCFVLIYLFWSPQNNRNSWRCHWFCTHKHSCNLSIKCPVVKLTNAASVPKNIQSFHTHNYNYSGNGAERSWLELKKLMKVSRHSW